MAFTLLPVSGHMFSCQVCNENVKMSSSGDASEILTILTFPFQSLKCVPNTDIPFSFYKINIAPTSQTRHTQSTNKITIDMCCAEAQLIADKYMVITKITHNHGIWQNFMELKYSITNILMYMLKLYPNPILTHTRCLWQFTDLACNPVFNVIN